jgi:BASS family bile acid:Na+ symporter
MTDDQWNRLINILASVTLFEMMVAIGLGVTFADVAGVAKNWRLVGRVAFANYVCFPAAAVGLLLVLGTNPLISAGFLIAEVCPGAPYGPPFTAVARGNVVVAVALMVLLAGSSAVAAPLLLRLLLPVTSGDIGTQIDAGSMVSTLLVAQFLPLVIGLGVRHRRPALAAQLKTPAGILSMVLNIALLAAVVFVQIDVLIAIRARAFTGMSALVFAGLIAGWLLGGPGRETRTAVAMATAVRNVGVSLVIVTKSFPGSPAVAAATAFAIFQTVLLLLVALSVGRLTSMAATSKGVPGSPDESLVKGTVP